MTHALADFCRGLEAVGLGGLATAIRIAGTSAQREAAVRLARTAVDAAERVAARQARVVANVLRAGDVAMHEATAEALAWERAEGERAEGERAEGERAKVEEAERDNQRRTEERRL